MAKKRKQIQVQMTLSVDEDVPVSEAIAEARSRINHYQYDNNYWDVSLRDGKLRAKNVKKLNKEQS